MRFLPTFLLAATALPALAQPLSLQPQASGLSAEWETRPDRTYSLQFSTDLQSWQTVPVVFTGDGQPLRYTFAPPRTRSFFRLRSSTSGDTNRNRIPDSWEWRYFDHLDVDPNADPDGDGLSNWQEFTEDSSPVSFYNGQSPAIELFSGHSWTLQRGQPSQALNLRILQPNGEPWPNAPVLLSTTASRPVLQRPDHEPGQSFPSLIVRTDENGILSPRFHNIRLLLPTDSSISRLVLRISAGDARVRVQVKVKDPTDQRPPYNIRRKTLPDGSLQYSWSGHPRNAASFKLQEKQGRGRWITVIDIPADQIPPPDPETGRYSVTLPPPASIPAQ